MGNKSMVNKIGSNRNGEEVREPLAKERHGTKFQPFFLVAPGKTSALECI